MAAKKVTVLANKKSSARVVKKTAKKSVAPKPKKPTKYLYFFGNGKAEGRGELRELLGGKGAGLAEMTNLGIPVPPGFTISTDACIEYIRRKR